jgi:hypothetical protein
MNKHRGQAAWTRNMNMQHGHGHAASTWTCSINMDTKLAAEVSGGESIAPQQVNTRRCVLYGTASQNLLLCNKTVSKIMPLYYTAKSQKYFGT